MLEYNHFIEKKSTLTLFFLVSRSPTLYNPIFRPGSPLRNNGEVELQQASSQQDFVLTTGTEPAGA